jgi:N-hydroxyarylamine O-acetyltransferase
VPFENFDVYTKQGILLDFDTLFSKVVLARRGGYCFELNELFACLLEQLGFQVTCPDNRRHTLLKYRPPVC